MRAQTIAEKILSNHLVETKNVFAKDRVDIRPSAILTNEMLPMVALAKFYMTKAKKLNENFVENTMIILDHGGLGTTDKMIDLHQMTINFAKQHNLRIELPGAGISHVVFHEKGMVKAGDLVLGTDSHTVTHGALNSFAKGIGGSDLVEIMVKGTTWLDVPESIRISIDNVLPQNVFSKDLVLSILAEKSMKWGTDRAFEYTGEGISNLSIESRLTISNMAVEMGGIAGIMPYDKVLADYFKRIPIKGTPKPMTADKDAVYFEKYSIDASEVVPMVAKPYSPDNSVPIAEVGTVELDQVFIGSCTNARIEDLEIVAKTLKNHKVKVPTIVIPGSASVALEATKSGYTEIIMRAGATWAYSTCGACFGGTLGKIGKNMTALSTTNRNFIGRMGGDESSKVYLGSPATAAASALAGKIMENSQF